MMLYFSSDVFHCLESIINCLKLHIYQFAYNRLFCTYLHIRSASKEGMLGSCHISDCFKGQL